MEHNQSNGVWLIAALVFTATLLLVVYSRRLRRRRRSKTIGSGLGDVLRRDDRISAEIRRLCSGADPNEALIRQMSSEERALFEVSIMDALNAGTREDQHRLRSTLIKYGYDEQCSRRVMSENLSDRIRAMALLNLLRPQWRDTVDTDHGEAVDEMRRARAAIRSTGPLDSD